LLKRSLIFNLFLALLVVIGLLFLFFNSLDWLTNHNKETTVPNLEGKNMNEAVKLLKKQGFAIQVDSTYQSYKKPLEVLFQEPISGAKVKVGRTVFLTVNRKTPPSIPMPNLVGISFRNALLTMQSFRLVMGDTIYKPDLATGSVLEQLYKGKPIGPGNLVPVGSKIDLVIAEGFSGAVDVPNLIGMTWKEVSGILDSLVITPNVVWEGSITDSNNAIVYAQSPESLNELDFRNSINQGDLIDLRVLQNPSQDLLLQNQPGSNKLLGNDEAIPSDTTEVPIATVKQSDLSTDHNDKDTVKKRRHVPGMDVPTSKPKVDPDQGVDDNLAKTKSKKRLGIDNNTKDKGVNAKTDKTGVTSKHTKPKTDKPVKQSDDQTKNEYD
jgi:eukaryotic-like serine/threonine-protein kinase